MVEPRTDHARFLEHFLAVRGLLRAFLHAATRNPHDTDDLCQQVGSVLWRKFNQYDADRPFAAWAVGIARMELLKWREQSARAGRVMLLSDEAVASLAAAAADAGPSDADQPDDRTLALRDCVGRLAPRTRTVVQMKYRDGRAIRQIAEAQGREVGAVEMTLVRARRALKQCVEDKLKAEDHVAHARRASSGRS